MTNRQVSLETYDDVTVVLPDGRKLCATYNGTVQWFDTVAEFNGFRDPAPLEINGEVIDASVPPERKIEIIRALGFTAMRLLHDADCAGNVDSSLCNCVPPATMWSQPDDVSKLRGETWEERLAKAQAKTARAR